MPVQLGAGQLLRVGQRGLGRQPKHRKFFSAAVGFEAIFATYSIMAPSEPDIVAWTDQSLTRRSNHQLQELIDA